MFNGITIEKLLLIGLIAGMIIGPQRLPRYAAALGQFVRRARDFARSAGSRVKEEMGEDFDDVVSAVAAAAYKQCHPLANIPGDHEYRREMVPVYVKRTLRAALAGTGPVHHI